MIRVSIIGLGGIGSHLVEALARFLITLPQPPELVLVDGDSYTIGNADRQRMGRTDLGLNKAGVHARRLASLLPGIRIHPVEEFLSERNAGEVVVEGSITVACPDNHATRLLVSRRCQRLRNGAAVLAGNDLSDGAVQILVRRNGRNLTHPPETYHRDIAEPRDTNPADLSCEELAARPGGGQIITANLMAASLALNVVVLLLEGRVPPFAEVYFDTRSNKARTCER